MFDMAQTAGFVPLQQSPEFIGAMQSFGVQTEALDVAGAANGCAVMQSGWWPCLGWVGLISRGPVWNGAPSARTLADVLRAQRHPVVLNAEDMDRLELQRAGFLHIMTPSSVAMWDLSISAQGLRAGMHQKWRNRLRRAEHGRLRVRQGPLPVDGHHWLLEREATLRKQRKYKGLPGILAAHYAKVNPDMARLFWAELDGRPVAGMVFLRHGQGATYFLGHSNEDGRARHAHTLVLARAAEWFSEHGVLSLDLGTIDTVNAPGLARFKLGCGAQARILGGTWLYTRRLAAVLRKVGQT